MRQGWEQSQDRLEVMLETHWRRSLGTTVGNGYERRKFIRTSARRLKAHLDTIGWPETEEEIEPYITRTIERYG